MNNVKEEDLRNIYQKLYDLSILANKMKNQQKLLDKVISNIFGEKLKENIITNGDMSDGIIAYFSNGDSYDFESFKREFNKVLKEELPII